VPDRRVARCHQGQPGDHLTPLLLGLDVGTTHIKALLVDGEGRECGQATVATPFARGEMTVGALVRAVAVVIGQLGQTRSQVAAVGIAGIAESGAPLSRDAVASAPVIAWHDPRGLETVELLGRRFGPSLEVAVGQRLRVVSSVAKLGWLVGHGVGPVARWLGVPELVLHALTGSQVTEFSLAARTGAYDVRERRYIPEVAEAIGVAPDVFAEVGAAGTLMGRVSPGAGAQFGLPAGIGVTIAGHDHLVAWAGAGARATDLVNSVGTAETVVAVSATCPAVHAALAQRVAVSVMPEGRAWALLASATRAGLVLAEVAAALGPSVGELDRLAEGAGSTPGGDEVIEDALAGTGLDFGDAPAGAVWNGVLAALAARTWDACDRVADVFQASEAAAGALSNLIPVAVANRSQPSAKGRQPRAGGRLIVCGGGSRSGPWLRAKAEARADIAVWRCGAAEAVARGAALYAGVAAGWWPGVDSAPAAGLEAVATK